MTSLEKLEAKNNLLESIPETIGFLVKLEELHLSGNAQLTTLPRAIGYCNRIEVVPVPPSYTSFPRQERLLTFSWKGIGHQSMRADESPRYLWMYFASDGSRYHHKQAHTLT